MRKHIVVTLLVVLATVLNARADGSTEEARKASERIQESTRVFHEIMEAPDQGIPRDLLSKAHCIAIIPSMKRGGFVFGARYGKGVLTCRDRSNVGWTGPSTVRIEGGSFGLQIGASATDLVLLVMNERGAEELMKSEFTLGGDATVAAGPVGRSVKAETDTWMHAKILAYSRSHGVFAGAVIEGATLRSDDSDNWRLYGRQVGHEEILQGKAGIPPAASGLISTLNRYSSSES
ncbi:MAG: hypothetical protein A3F68_06130 [Acidobacteria bacterium RIFCSPLOWO2_12_FULL_54_10]|nr:MAG: hypothetical protein A3F68_06130 [Acidobacteria bacterium RIFCSPLOWO2_12_FULL_54_10]